MQNGGFLKGRILCLKGISLFLHPMNSLKNIALYLVLAIVIAGFTGFEWAGKHFPVDLYMEMGEVQPGPESKDTEKKPNSGDYFHPTGTKFDEPIVSLAGPVHVCFSCIPEGHPVTIWNPPKC